MKRLALSHGGQCRVSIYLYRRGPRVTRSLVPNSPAGMCERIICVISVICVIRKSTVIGVRSKLMHIWEHMHVGRLEKLRPWRWRGAAGARLPPDPVAYRWRSPRSRVENPSHVLLFYRDELNKISLSSLCGSLILVGSMQDYSQALEESKLWTHS